MSLPQSHPSVHVHSGKVCPVAGRRNEYCGPQPGDSRSACPALNAMANHGYIPRDGKNISAFDIIKGLKACYGLSNPLAIFLAVVGFLMLKRVRPLALFDIGVHGVIEHDASLVHHDTPTGQRFAPIEIDETLVQKLVDDVVPDKLAADSAYGPLMDAADVARSRVRRQKECRALDSLHAEIARGEMAIILGVWEKKPAGNGKVGIPVDWVRQWVGSERLPEGWKPDHVQGLLDVIKRSKAIRASMDAISKAKTSEDVITDEKVKL